MIDIQHDSPVPIHEQITSQLMAQVAAGTLKAGARLAEYRAFAQHLLTNPQVVAKAYGELEWEGVLARQAEGGMEVTANAALICRLRLQEKARNKIREAVAQGMAWGLADSEIREAVEGQLAAPAPLTDAEVVNAIKKPTHASSHRNSQGIQVLPQQKSAGPPQPDRTGGSDFRAARG
jgi:GntR family transcriptional regulator